MTTGSIHNRDAFLNRIADRLGRKRVRSAPMLERLHRPELDVYKDFSQDELLSVFKNACQNIHTDVYETTAEALGARLSETIHALGGGPVVCGADPRFREYGLDPVLEEEEAFIWDPSLGQVNIEKAAAANIGLAFSDVTLAESGTVAFFHDKWRSRSVGLLPTQSIVIVPKHTLVPRLTQAVQNIEKRADSGEAVASYINFVSGPSNSADIEMNLVVGVHGPVRVAYIVVTDR